MGLVLGHEMPRPRPNAKIHNAVKIQEVELLKILPFPDHLNFSMILTEMNKNTTS